MTVTKLTISLDSDVAERVRSEVAAGRATSVSAWLNEAAIERADRDSLRGVLTEIFERTGGPLRPDELARAQELLQAAESAPVGGTTG